MRSLFSRELVLLLDSSVCSRKGVDAGSFDHDAIRLWTATPSTSHSSIRRNMPPSAFEAISLPSIGRSLQCLVDSHHPIHQQSASIQVLLQCVQWTKRRYNQFVVASQSRTHFFYEILSPVRHHVFSSRASKVSRFDLEVVAASPSGEGSFQVVANPSDSLRPCDTYETDISGVVTDFTATGDDFLFAVKDVDTFSV